MRPIFLIRISAILLMLSAISCEKKSNNHRVELDDSIKHVIIQYVKENNIDVRSRLITTDWVVNTFRTDVYISNSFRHLDDSLHDEPTYYAVLSDSIVVLVYTGIENTVVRNTQEISSEIKFVLDKNNLRLRPDDGNFYHEPKWVYTLCDRSNLLVKKSSAFELFHIPFGYMLLHDTVRNDSSFIVVKRNH